MPCHPNESWLAPDNEHSVSSGDYVFRCQRASTIQHHNSTQLKEHGLSEVCNDCRTTKLQSYLDNAVRGPRWLWGGKMDDGPNVGGGVLIFANFGGEYSDHKHRILDAQTKSKPRKELPAEIKEAEKTLIEQYRAQKTMKAEKNRTSHDINQQSALISNLTDSEILSRVARHGGYISWDIVDIVIRWESAEVKKAMLTVLSGQSHLENPRPVMLFFGGLRETYQYHRSQRQDDEKLEHPLASSWFEQGTKGGFFLSRRPNEFLDVLNGSERHDVDFGIERPNPRDVRRWLNRMAVSLVGGWLSMHGKALDVSNETLNCLSYSLALFKIDMKFTDLPGYATKRALITDESSRISAALRTEREGGAMSANEDDVLTDSNNLVEQFSELVPHVIQLLKDSERPLE